MSRWVVAPQPPLAPSAGLQVGTGLLDDLFDTVTPRDLLTKVLGPVAIGIATNEAGRTLNGDRTPYNTYHRIVVPAAKALIGSALNEAKNRIAQQIPDEWGEPQLKRKREHEPREGLGVGASHAIRPIIRNPNVRRFAGDFHNELVSRGADELAQRLSKIELEHRRAEFKRNKHKPSRRRTT